jgi:hypothetical protein
VLPTSRNLRKQSAIDWRKIVQRIGRSYSLATDEVTGVYRKARQLNSFSHNCPFAIRSDTNNTINYPQPLGQQQFVTIR